MQLSTVALPVGDGCSSEHLFTLQFSVVHVAPTEP
jgi:hypothetical protein